MSEFIQAEYFRPYVGKIFRVVRTEFAFPLVDIMISNGRLPPDAKRRPFLLIFRTVKARSVLPEGLYDCEIEGGLKTSLYITPIHTPQAGWQDYQSFFN